jgi:hypothetical protein
MPYIVLCQYRVNKIIGGYAMTQQIQAEEVKQGSISWYKVTCPYCNEENRIHGSMFSDSDNLCKHFKIRLSKQVIFENKELTK